MARAWRPRDVEVRLGSAGAALRAPTRDILRECKDMMRGAAVR